MVWARRGGFLGQHSRSGFSALPGEYRDDDGPFPPRGDSGFWWSATEQNASGARARHLNANYPDLGRDWYPKGWGMSLRLVRDLN
jgi:uncharacterized protein (TIGR02145 family)